MKILIPTDFSRTADKALTYAIEFAEKTNSSLILYHSFIPLGSAFYSQYQTMKENKLIIGDLNRRLDMIKEKASATTRVKISTYLDAGAETKSIVRFAEKNKLDLIIMGTTGASGLKEKLIGSVTAVVMQNASCPVIGIPYKFRLRPVKNIAFATDFRMEDLISLKYLRNIARRLNAAIQVYHFNEGEYNKEYEQSLFRIYSRTVKNIIPNTRLSFHTEKVKHIRDALNRLARKRNIDMLAMNSHKKHGFFKKLTDKSLLKDLAYHTRIPLLSFPARQD